MWSSSSYSKARIPTFERVSQYGPLAGLALNALRRNPSRWYSSIPDHRQAWAEGTVNVSVKGSFREEISRILEDRALRVHECSRREVMVCAWILNETHPKDDHYHLFLPLATRFINVAKGSLLTGTRGCWKSS